MELLKRIKRQTTLARRDDEAHGNIDARGRSDEGGRRGWSPNPARRTRRLYSLLEVTRPNEPRAQTANRSLDGPRAVEPFGLIGIADAIRAFAPDHRVARVERTLR